MLIRRLRILQVSVRTPPVDILRWGTAFGMTQGKKKHVFLKSAAAARRLGGSKSVRSRAVACP